MLAEFYQQGEEEAKRGLAVSALCDRDGGNVWSSQIGFIDFIIKPLFTTWCEFLGSDEVNSKCLTNIEANREMWAKMQRQNASQQPYKDAALLQESLFELNDPPPVQERADAFSGATVARSRMDL